MVFALSIGDTIILQDYIDESGKSVGHYEGSGLQPLFLDKFRMNGIDMPNLQ